MADALDLGSSVSRRGGSSPFTRTISGIHKGFGFMNTRFLFFILIFMYRAGFMSALYESPFGPYSAAWRLDLKASINHTEIFASAFLNQYEALLTSSGRYTAKYPRCHLNYPAASGRISLRLSPKLLELLFARSLPPVFQPKDRLSVGVSPGYWVSVIAWY